MNKKTAIIISNLLEEKFSDEYIQSWAWASRDVDTSMLDITTLMYNIKNHKSIVDANGIEWTFTGYRLYVAGSDEEFKAEGISVQENGYQVRSYKKALEILEHDGYMDK